MVLRAGFLRAGFRQPAAISESIAWLASALVRPARWRATLSLSFAAGDTVVGHLEGQMGEQTVLGFGLVGGDSVDHWGSFLCLYHLMVPQN